MSERKIRKLLKKSIPIETERLIIRYVTQDDCNDMYEYSSLPEVCRFLLWSPHINVTATSGYIEFLEKRYLRGLYGDWAVELKENHKMVGTCGFANVDTSADTCEIGYVLSPAYRGKGYMTEAVQAVLDLAFDKLGLGCAKLRIIRENTDSIKLAERIGFSRDERGEYPLDIKGETRYVIDYLMYNNMSKKNEAD
ncbi:MAG: GNAT family N-acetyltransferase [Clostridia bacterium]|nr:GNAT family N-acetyltransferase [Clostridia bacterium]